MFPFMEPFITTVPSLNNNNYFLKRGLDLRKKWEGLLGSFLHVAHLSIFLLELPLSY